MNFFTTDVDIYQYKSTISQATSLNPPSWQEVPALPAMQPPMMQLPVIWSQGPLQLQWLAQFNPQWVLGQSVDSITIQKKVSNVTKIAKYAYLLHTNSFT